MYFDQVIISGTPSAPFANGNIEGISDALRAQMLATNDHIRLYPNPTNDILNIVILEESYDEITIFSTTGNIVKSVKDVENTMSIDVSEYATGLYFVRFVTGKFAVTKRFVKE